MSYLIRVVLPDRPGALGAVATALGHAGADILSVDIVERTPTHAIDDLVVEVAGDKLADSVVTAASSVEGVRVESIRPYAGQIDPYRELDLLEQLAEKRDQAHQLLADGICKIFRAGWAILLSAPAADSLDAPVVTWSSAAPEVDSVPAPWWPAHPARALSGAEEWVPADWASLDTELAVAPLGDDAILLGRPALRWLPSEVLRLSHLASIAATVLQP